MSEVEARRLSISHQLGSESASIAKHGVSAESAAAEAAHFAAGIAGIEWELVNLELRRSVFKISHARAAARMIAEADKARAAQMRMDFLLGESSRLAFLSRNAVAEECTAELQWERD